MVAAVVPAEAWGAAAARAAAVQDRAGPAVAQVLTPVAAEGCPVTFRLCWSIVATVAMAAHRRAVLRDLSSPMRI